MTPVPPTLILAAVRSDEQLRKLMSGYYSIMLIVVIGLLGLTMILALAMLWRRSLKRQRALESQIAELRAAGAGLGDAWAAAARRVEVPGARRAHDPEAEEDEDEEVDPYNLFGGRDPMEDTDDDEDEEDGFDEDDEDDEFDEEDEDDGGRPGDRR